MATISRFPWVRHVRGESTSWIGHHRNGAQVRAGRGLAFWFLPLSASISEVPVDDRELPILFHARSQDYQDVVVQAVLSWRVLKPVVLAERFDFTIDLDDGNWHGEPLEQVAQLLTQLAQQLAWTHLANTSVRDLLRSSVDAIRDPIAVGLASDATLAELGIEVVSVRIVSIRPDSDVERALETPARESIQQQADEATFQRRALAVDKERAIAENELANRLELAKREEALIAQEGQNQQRKVEQDTHQKRLAAVAAAERQALADQTRADGVRLLETANNEAERARVAIYEALPPSVLLALAARQLADNPPAIEHLSVGPDSFGPAIRRLLDAGTGALEGTG